MGRSAAFWSNNMYSDPDTEPRPGAPGRDLPRLAAGRFRRLREGVLRLAGVVETVRYMNRPWHWAWEYAVGPRRLCWLHFVDEGIAVTFTVSDADRERIAAGERVSGFIQDAIREGQQTGPVCWCLVTLEDRRSVDLLLGFLRRKLGWIEADTAARVAQQRRSLAS